MKKHAHKTLPDTIMYNGRSWINSSKSELSVDGDIDGVEDGNFIPKGL